MSAPLAFPLFVKNYSLLAGMQNRKNEFSQNSTVFTDTSLAITNGAVIWVESDVQVPGMKVVNNDDVDGSHCIMTAGYNPVDGTIKQCTDPFQTSKRFKESATVANASIDLVFDVSASPDIQNYRVFHKYINAIAGTRIGGFTVQLGFGTGGSFVPSVASDGLGFATRAGLVYDPIVPTPSSAVDDVDLEAVFAFGLFGDADTNPNQTTDGYFDPTQRASFALSAVEDTIVSVGTPTANYYNLFNNWLAKNQVPYGYFYDEDGDPLTDATLIANWNGVAWESYTSASPLLPFAPGMPKGRVVGSAAGLFGVSVAAVGFSPSVPVALVILMALGLAMITTTDVTNTLLQTLVPDGLRGRVISVYTFSFVGMAQIGAFLGGTAAERFGVAATLGVGGVLTVAAAMSLLVRSRELQAAR